MTTWREAIAAKNERIRREARFYTPDLLGRPCPECGLKVPTAIGAAFHPTCGSDARAFLRMAAIQEDTPEEAPA